jgi:hypothetical protein
MQPALEALLKKRKDRSIAIILGVKERECDRHLPEQASLRLRKVILDQLNELYEIVIDITASLDTGDVVLNEEYLGKIDRMVEELAALRARDISERPFSRQVG